MFSVKHSQYFTTCTLWRRFLHTLKKILFIFHSYLLYIIVVNLYLLIFSYFFVPYVFECRPKRYNRVLVNLKKKTVHTFISNSLNMSFCIIRSSFLLRCLSSFETQSFSVLFACSSLRRERLVLCYLQFML